MIKITLAYDMRAPSFGPPAVELYQAALDQCEWADKLGFSRVSFMEHHASSDGYLPSPLVMAAAAAGRTREMEIAVSVMLLPLYHPLRAAEDLAVLDLAANGRLRLTVGAGYREEEYAQFDLSLKKRPSLMERGVATLKKAWTGEPFDYEGKTVRILPTPAQAGGPDIVMGGSSPAAAKRAARIADGFFPVVPELFDIYLDELKALNKPLPETAQKAPASYRFLHISHDPQAAWEKIAPHALHENNDYAQWLKDAPNAVYTTVSDPGILLSSGAYKIVTPAECLAMARRDGFLELKPLMGGLSPQVSWESLRLFEKEVLPYLGE